MVQASVTSNGLGIGANRALMEAEFFLNKRNITPFRKETSSQFTNVRKDISSFRDITLSRFNNVDSKLTKIDNQLQEVRKEFQTFNKKIKEIEKKIDNLPEKTSDQVSFKVVCESYFRYDSTSSFYPTLFFRYKENIDGPYARVSQIKMKLKKKEPRCYRTRHSVFEKPVSAHSSYHL